MWAPFCLPYWAWAMNTTDEATVQDTFSSSLYLIPPLLTTLCSDSYSSYNVSRCFILFYFFYKLNHFYVLFIWKCISRGVNVKILIDVWKSIIIFFHGYKLCCTSFILHLPGLYGMPQCNIATTKLMLALTDRRWICNIRKQKLLSINTYWNHKG